MESPLELIAENEEQSETYEDTLYFAKLPAVQYTLLAFYSVTLLVSCSSNIIVSVIICRRKELRTTCNMFILNLMVADVFYCFTGVLFTPIGLMYEGSSWSQADYVCKIVPTIAAASVHVISLSSLVIALYRYWRTVRGCRRALSLRQAVLMDLLVWLCAALLCVPMAMHSRTTGSRCVESWEDDEVALRRLYSLSCFALQFVLPAGLIAFCYFRTVRHIRAHYDRLLTSVCVLQQRKVREKLRRKKNLSKLSIAIIGCFLLCFSPLNAFMMVVDFHHSLVHRSRVSVLLFLLAHACTSLSTVANPVLYGCLNSSFQRQLKRCVFLHACCKPLEPRVAPTENPPATSAAVRQPSPVLCVPACFAKASSEAFDQQTNV